MKSTVRFRCCLWADLDTGGELYGIQAQFNKGEMWMHCCDDGKLVVFKTKTERAAKMKELRAQVRDNATIAGA